MTQISLGRESYGKPPAAYLDFIDEMRNYAVERGLSWDIDVESDGRILRTNDWDLRKLNGSHGAYGAGCFTFAVEVETRDRLLAYGVPAALLPLDERLAEASQEFIKAVLVYRCSSGNSLGTAQASAKACRRLLSSTQRPPWALREEDFAQLIAAHTWTDKAQRDVLSIAKILDERLMSENCPVKPQLTRGRPPELAKSLDERNRGDRLPERDALLELSRIVFQEEPLHHNDRVWFCAVRLMMLTGLRLNEICMLPFDCLDWQEHIDVVTRKSASEVGGVGKSLRLRYFAEKHSDGRPDLLVEAFQCVPQRFESLVAEAVETAQRATAELRSLLTTQQSDAARYPRSDFRRFQTTSGATVNVADFLLLSIARKNGYQSNDVPSSDTAVVLCSSAAVYRGMGGGAALGLNTFFMNYGRKPEHKGYSLRPHSLRHLLNTELFRQNVPDTAITHQFGRTTVAQSYEYDHRSLAERLQFVRLPSPAEPRIAKGTTQELVAKMVVSGVAATSHLGQSFKKIQLEHGDDAAFSYLAANSDGFHVTPYGFCTNSFSVNPCSRHLKCFDNCKHFAPTGMAEHVVTLQDLRKNLLTMRDVAQRKPATTVGRKNQIAHAERLVRGVDAALAAQPGLPVFPQGTDHSSPSPDIFK